MNNETFPSLSSQVIFDTYTATVELYTYVGSLTLLFYASLLHLPDEVEYMWRRKFTLPTYLYFLSKYPIFVFFVLFIVSNSLPTSSSLRVCNILAIVGEVAQFLSFLGIQGLISVRTYTLCQGYRPMTITLCITFLTAVTSQIYDDTIPVCTTGQPGKLGTLLDLISDISVIVLDALASVSVIYHVWGLWKLKRSSGLQNEGDIVTLLLKQGILRFLFAIFITTTITIVLIFVPIVGFYVVVFQLVLSTLLICEFTLALRRRNAPQSIPNQSAMNLTTLSFQSFRPVRSVRAVLGQLHENIMAEMGERTDRVDIDSSVLEEQDDLWSQSHDMNLGRQGNPAQ